MQGWDARKSRFDFAWIGLLAFAFPALSYLWQGHIGISLADEGFLWYGAQQTAAGAVPIRDFMAYDPARYYWSAAFMRLSGDDGLIQLRISLYAAQFAALLLGLLALRDRSQKGALGFLVLSGMVLSAWMVPHFKIFDIVASLALVAALTALAASPQGQRYFLCGVVVGLAAAIGRNHGVYGAIASLACILWLNIRPFSPQILAKAVAYWSFGVLLGFSPILLMAAFIPGFAPAFRDSILFLFQINATNLPLPVPWPWKISFTGQPLLAAIQQVTIGLYFLGLILFGLLSLAWVLFRRLSGKPVAPVLAACAFLSIPYAHYAFSRADLPHLALGIFPLLIGVLALLRQRRPLLKWSMVLVLAATGILATATQHPLWRCLPDNSCRNVALGDDEIRLTDFNATHIAILKRLERRYAPGGRPMLVMPYWPGAYSVLERPAPVWELYALFARDRAFEEREIERIRTAAPPLVVIADWRLDGRDELRFKNTHPLTYRFIRETYELVETLPFSKRHPSAFIEVYAEKRK